MQRVAVTLDGAPVRGSPFAVYVRAGPLHAPACLLLGLDDHRAASAGNILTTDDRRRELSDASGRWPQTGELQGAKAGPAACRLFAVCDGHSNPWLRVVMFHMMAVMCVQAALRP